MSWLWQVPRGTADGDVLFKAVILLRGLADVLEPDDSGEVKISGYLGELLADLLRSTEAELYAISGKAHLCPDCVCKKGDES